MKKQLPQLENALRKLLSNKSIKSRQASLQLLGRLVQVLPGCLNDHFAALVPGIEFCLT